MLGLKINCIFTEKHYKLENSDKQDAKLAYQLLSDETANIIQTYFANDPKMMALHKFVKLFATVKKIMTSRVI